MFGRHFSKLQCNESKCEAGLRLTGAIPHAELSHSHAMYVLQCTYMHSTDASSCSTWSHIPQPLKKEKKTFRSWKAFYFLGCVDEPVLLAQNFLILFLFIYYVSKCHVFKLLCIDKIWWFRARPEFWYCEQELKHNFECGLFLEARVKRLASPPESEMRQISLISLSHLHLASTIVMFFYDCNKAEYI